MSSIQKCQILILGLNTWRRHFPASEESFNEGRQPFHSWIREDSNEAECGERRREGNWYSWKSWHIFFLWKSDWSNFPFDKKPLHPPVTRSQSVLHVTNSSSPLKNVYWELIWDHFRWATSVYERKACEGNVFVAQVHSCSRNYLN